MRKKAELWRHSEESEEVRNGWGSLVSMTTSLHRTQKAALPLLISMGRLRPLRESLLPLIPPTLTHQPSQQHRGKRGEKG